MKNIYLYLLLWLMLLATSCKSFQVAVPGSLRNNSEKYHVKGANVSVFGHKIKIEGFGEAKMYSGFVTRKGTDNSLFPLYYNVDSRLRFINNHFRTEEAETQSKYHFDLVSNGIYVNTYCVAQLSKTAIHIKHTGVSIGMDEDYSFDGLIFTNKAENPWRLTFSGSKSIDDGWNSYVKNVRQTDGRLSNDSTTIDVKLVRINTRKEDGTATKIPFKIPVGYEFKQDNQLLAFVDLFDRNIWVSNAIDAHTKAVLVSAATSILVKANAS